jgi:hypothetical protein
MNLCIVCLRVMFHHIYHNQQSTMSVSTKDPFNNFIKTLSNSQSMKDDLDEQYYYVDLEEIVNKAMKEVSDRTGNYLHNLRKHQPDEDTLLKIIDNVASSLFQFGLQLSTTRVSYTYLFSRRKDSNTKWAEIMDEEDY